MNGAARETRKGGAAPPGRVQAPWFAAPEREALVAQLDALHDRAWTQPDLLKRTEIESEFQRVRAELTERDRKATEANARGVTA